MPSLKERMINKIIKLEGGYTDNPDDSGGKTIYGITEEVARANGYCGNMEYMACHLAFDIYTRQYWDAVDGDTLVELSEAVAEEVVDTAVNMGVDRASEFLQRTLNVLNKGGDLYDDLNVDRDIGQLTLAALAAYMAFRDESVFVKALNCLQGSFYIELAERREKDETFLYGWLRNRVAL